MSRFIWQPGDRLTVGARTTPPRTAQDLLRDLGVSRAARPAQRSAVLRWLVSHDPDPLMKSSLKRRELPTESVIFNASWQGIVLARGGTLTIDLAPTAQTNSFQREISTAS